METTDAGRTALQPQRRPAPGPPLRPAVPRRDMKNRPFVIALTLAFVALFTWSLVTTIGASVKGGHEPFVEWRSENVTLFYGIWLATVIVVGVPALYFVGRELNRFAERQDETALAAQGRRPLRRRRPPRRQEADRQAALAARRSHTGRPLPVRARPRAARRHRDQQGALPQGALLGRRPQARAHRRAQADKRHAHRQAAASARQGPEPHGGAAGEHGDTFVGGKGTNMDGLSSSGSARRRRGRRRRRPRRRRTSAAKAPVRCGRSPAQASRTPATEPGAAKRRPLRSRVEPAGRSSSRSRHSRRPLRADPFDGARPTIDTPTRGRRPIACLPAGRRLTHARPCS